MLKKNSFTAEIAELKLLFGDPVLSAENPAAYDRILAALLETFLPSDIMERRWLKQTPTRSGRRSGRRVIRRFSSIASFTSNKA